MDRSVIVIMIIMMVVEPIIIIVRPAATYSDIKYYRTIPVTVVIRTVSPEIGTTEIRIIKSTIISIIKAIIRVIRRKSIA